MTSPLSPLLFCPPFQADAVRFEAIGAALTYLLVKASGETDHTDILDIAFADGEKDRVAGTFCTYASAACRAASETLDTVISLIQRDPDAVTEIFGGKHGLFVSACIGGCGGWGGGWGFASFGW